MRKICLLDCTLRDGAYIVNGEFGTTAMKGIMKKLELAGVDIIECGWLKDAPHKEGTTFFHVAADSKPYLPPKNGNTLYVAMIDWDRYDLDQLPDNDGETIDAIRVVFPKDHYKEGIALGDKIKKKGYQVLFQAANTLAYSNEELIALVEEINRAEPIAVSVVDTFGAMYVEDMERIVSVINHYLNPGIGIGFHSHNNLQMSFALSMQFVNMLHDSDRMIIVDASLCGMGRGAGNATTELVAQFLVRKYNANYDLDHIMDAIDIYMEYFKEKYEWGYSTPHFVAGMYCCHVNNIAYLLKNHRCSAMDMRNVIGMLSEDKRKIYDYENLEKTYLDYQGRKVDDTVDFERLATELRGKSVVLIAPGKSSLASEDKIKQYIQENHSVVIAVNAILPVYDYDYLFFANAARYEYSKTKYPDTFSQAKKILLSSIKQTGEEKEILINYEKTVKRGWEHFDNAVILALRMLDRMGLVEVAVAGFDGFKNVYNDSYADPQLPTLNPDNKWEELNVEIKEIYMDFRKMAKNIKDVFFITESIFDR